VIVNYRRPTTLHGTASAAGRGRISPTARVRQSGRSTDSQRSDLSRPRVRGGETAAPPRGRRPATQCSRRQRARRLCAGVSGHYRGAGHLVARRVGLASPGVSVCRSRETSRCAGPAGSRRPQPLRTGHYGAELDVARIGARQHSASRLLTPGSEPVSSKRADCRSPAREEASTPALASLPSWTNRSSRARPPAGCWITRQCGRTRRLRDTAGMQRLRASNQMAIPAPAHGWIRSDAEL
jgi:hypothetical protein